MSHEIVFDLKALRPQTSAKTVCLCPNIIPVSYFNEMEETEHYLCSLLIPL